MPEEDLLDNVLNKLALNSHSQEFHHNSQEIQEHAQFHHHKTKELANNKLCNNVDQELPMHSLLADASSLNSVPTHNQLLMLRIA